METNRINRNPAILQVGVDCDAGESKEEPLFLRPRRANGHGTGPNGPRVPSVFCVFTFCTTTIVVLNSTIRQGPVHDLVNFLDLVRNKGRGQYSHTNWFSAKEWLEGLSHHLLKPVQKGFPLGLCRTLRASINEVYPFLGLFDLFPQQTGAP